MTSIWRWPGHDHCYTRTYQMLGGVAQNGLESVAVNPPGTLYLTASSASGSMFYTLKDADAEYRAVRWPENKPSYSGHYRKRRRPDRDHL